MKRAILQVADTGPLESLVAMLESVGYKCFLPNKHLRDRLRRLGCDTVLDIKGLVSGWGYEWPSLKDELGPEAMSDIDLFVDIKAHRNGPLVWKEWPRLIHRTLWYRINGGRPEHVIKKDGTDCGDEVNLNCPILTPNLWYQNCLRCNGSSEEPWSDNLDCGPRICSVCRGSGKNLRAYAFWPPFVRFNEYFAKRDRAPGGKWVEPPMCLIHNLVGWGYGKLVESVQALGVKCYGAGSPDGLVPHDKIPEMLSKSLAMVHLKSSDAPGYALYEALAAACPLIVSKRLIWRNRMEELYEPGVTCLAFDRETHDSLSDEDVFQCKEQIRSHLDTLCNPRTNRDLGMAGMERLKSLMWGEGANRERDVASLREFMERNFPV